MRRSAEFLPSLLVFVITVAVYVLSPVRISYDSAYALPMALSILRDGDMRLDEYAARIEPGDYRIFEANGHLYSGQTFGSSLAAVPFVAAADLLSIDLEEHLISAPALELERLISSILLASALVLLYQAARLLKLARTSAMLLVLMIAFGTAVWSVFSRSFWTHSPSMLVLSVVLLILLRAPEKPARIAWFAPLFVYLYFTRPNLILIGAVLAVYVWFEYRAVFVRFVLYGVIAALPVFALNWAEFGRLTSPYYSQFAFTDQPVQAVFAQFISPNRGLFVYSPFLAFFVVGVIHKLRRKQFTRLDAAILIAMLGTTAVYSVWQAWHSGHSYGNRFMADLLPFFFYWLVYFYAALKRMRAPVQTLISLAFVISAGIGVGINGIGAAYWEGWKWNNYPVDVNQALYRVWDWEDPAFLRFRLFYEHEDARRLSAAGDYQAAIMIWTRTLVYEPLSVEMLIGRGTAYRALGDCEAAADFERAHTAAPSCP